eukprot:m.62938 g.62938  ORF g.62938 m.62938 type:complete len:261 (-) comp15819_c0_seq2:42-824(-)
MADSYDDFEVRGEMRIGVSQCALIGRLRDDDLIPAEEGVKPEDDIYTRHGIKNTIEKLSEKGIKCHRFLFRVTPTAKDMLSLFHAYIFYEDGHFVIALNGVRAAWQRQVRFINTDTNTTDHKRDLFSKVEDEEQKGRLSAVLNDGDCFQLGLEESVNRIRVTVYNGEANDGVEPYCHIREDPDPRHMPIMLTLWALTEKVDALQESVDMLGSMMSGHDDETGRKHSGSSTAATNVVAPASEPTEQDDGYLNIDGGAEDPN